MRYKLDVYSHYVKVTGFDKRGKEPLLEFCKPFGEFGLVRVGRGKFVRKMVRVYAAATKDRTEFRFHVTVLRELVQHLRMVVGHESDLSIEYHTPPDGVDCKLKMRKGYIPRDYQVGIVDYLTSTQKINVLELQTGKGKTLCALFSHVAMQKRTLLVVKAQYIDQWIKNYRESVEGPATDLMVVKGSKHLRMLIDLGIHNQLDAKFIIISSTTMMNFIKEYESVGKEGLTYDITPDQLCETLGVHTRIIDETHNMFHFNFKLDLYTHVPKTINLSATLKSDDAFKNRMYEVAYPMDCRYNGVQYDKYIASKALFYSLNDPRRIRYKARGMGSYSHIEFEKSLMSKKNKVLLENYVDLIADCVENEFIKLPNEPGQKMLIFVASKAMATLVTRELQVIHPNLKVARFIDEDPYKTVLESDIIVSTLLSAGTAIDIPGLAVALMTTALGSRQLNEQALGRLRRLKDWPDFTPRFAYLVCDDIPKHHEYHERKKQYFEDKVLSQKEQWLARRV